MLYIKVSRDKIDRIKQATGFKIGTLPVRYLGVPLIIRRLSTSDCYLLIERITARINNWTSKYLFYAGRLQLIQSIIFNIQAYWSRHFILPKRVLKAIAHKCSRFFWKGKVYL